jgi:hypothetical protein
MGREIRRVPPTWEHPKDYRGRYKPLYDRPWREAMQEWLNDYSDEWQTWTDEEDIESPPPAKYYRPVWIEEPTAYQMYETVTEGTPVSPVFLTIDELRTWLLEQGHSEKATDMFIKLGFAFSFVIGPKGITENLDAYDIY